MSHFSHDSILPAGLASLRQVLVRILSRSSRDTNETKYAFAVFRKTTGLRRSKISAEIYATAKVCFFD